MWEHCVKKRGGVRGGSPERDYTVEIKGRDRDPVRGILRDAIRIRKVGEGEVVEVVREVEGVAVERKISMRVEFLKGIVH